MPFCMRTLLYMLFRFVAVLVAVLPSYVVGSATEQPRNADQSIAAAHAVLEREMPQIASQIHLRLVPGDYAGKQDGFRISGSTGDIHVEAATTPTLLFGVNWYLKYVAHL